jgi:hypothetical protein
MAQYRVLSSDLIEYAGDWYCDGQILESDLPPAKALFHQNDKLAETINDYLERNLIVAV